MYYYTFIKPIPLYIIGGSTKHSIHLQLLRHPPLSHYKAPEVSQFAQPELV